MGEDRWDDECGSEQPVDVLNVAESGQEFEALNAVDVVQEIVEITVDAGAAKNVWPIEGRYEDKGDQDGEVGGNMR